MNLSIHISSLFVSLFEYYTHPIGKRRDPRSSKSVFTGGKNNVRSWRMNYLIPLMYLLKRCIRWLGRINQIAKNTWRNMSWGWCGWSSPCCWGRACSVVRCSLAFYKLYEFMYYFKSFIIWICITNQSISHSPPIRNHVLYKTFYYLNSYIIWIHYVTRHIQQMLPPIQVPKLMNYNEPHTFVAITMSLRLDCLVCSSICFLYSCLFPSRVC